MTWTGTDMDRLMRYDELVGRIYTDQRVTPTARELLLAVAWAVARAPQNADGPLRVAGRVLGRNRVGKPRIGDLIAEDAPRYRPPSDVTSGAGSMAPPCEGPRLRPYKLRPYTPRAKPDPDLVAPVPLRKMPPTMLHMPPGYVPPVDFRNEDMVCGATSHHRVIERDPVTGWHTAHWFCKRHHDQAVRVAGQVREQNEGAPVPIPNRGGLLPAYFEADWEVVYRHYLPRWEPPVYGLSADEWPTPGVDVLPVRPRLRLVSSTA